jgi:hypothetical protein
MAAKSNVVISEGQVTFKRVEGHKHDGLTSTLIDTSKYSMFDFVATENARDTSRSARQQNNKNVLKTFIIDTIEGRVLNPAGIRIQANAISAREIIAGTITADELSSNIVLVNNIIRSNNFINNTTTQTGWAIYSNGTGIFNNIQIRGNLVAGTGVYANTNTPIFANIGGYFSLGSNFTWNGSTLTIKGTLQFPDGSTPGTFDNGDAITDGFIGGININASEIQSNGFSAGSAGFRIGADGNAEFNNVTVRGALAAGSVGGLDVTGGNLVAGDEVALSAVGEYVKIDASGHFIAYKYVDNIIGNDYWVNVDINDTDAGITVRGTTNGTDLTSSITSSVIRAGLYLESATNIWVGSGYGIRGRGTYTYLGGDSDSVSTGTMRVVNATALYDDPSTTSSNKLVCITSGGTLQVYGGVANTYATSSHTHSYSEITSKPSLMPLGGATVSNFSLTTSQGNDAEGIMFESQRSGGGIALSTRANGFVSCSQFPGLATGGSAVLRLDGFLYFRSSTRAIKENIEYFDEDPSVAATNILKKLRPVKFTVKRNERDTDYTYALRQLSTEAGFIIEDIEEVQDQIDVSLLSYEATDPGKFDRVDRTPFSLEEDFEDIKPTMYKENAIMSIAVRAIQELTARVEELESSGQTSEGV